MKLKNVITINDFNFSQGGASKVAIDTANMIAKHGLNSIFISAVSNDLESQLNNDVVQYRYNGTEFLHYKNKFKGMLDGLIFKDFTAFVCEVLKQYRPEDTVIHVHGWTKACSSDFFGLIKRKGFKTFLTVHEYFSICPNGALLNFKTRHPCGKRCLSFDCLLTNCDSRNYAFKIYRYIRELIYYKTMDFDYIHVIFISEFQQSIITKIKHISHSSIIPNPVTPLASSATPEFDFIYIGRNAPEKGIELFVQAAEKNRDYSFLIVGDYENAQKIPNLSSTGWVSENDVDDYLKKSRVLVFPSLLPEPFGLNVVKAVYSGIPCLVSSNTGAADYIEPGKNGYVFEQGNINSMNEMIQKILRMDQGIDASNHPRSVYMEDLLNFYRK